MLFKQTEPFFSLLAPLQLLEELLTFKLLTSILCPYCYICSSSPTSIRSIAAFIKTSKFPFSFGKSKTQSFLLRVFY